MSVPPKGNDLLGSMLVVMSRAFQQHYSQQVTLYWKVEAGKLELICQWADSEEAKTK